MKGDKKADMYGCTVGRCGMCRGWTLLVAGVILLINAYWSFTQTWTLIAWLIALVGLSKVIWPCCPHCK